MYNQYEKLDKLVERAQDFYRDFKSKTNYNTETGNWIMKYWGVEVKEDVLKSMAEDVGIVIDFVNMNNIYRLRNGMKVVLKNNIYWYDELLKVAYKDEYNGYQHKEFSSLDIVGEL